MKIKTAFSVLASSLMVLSVGQAQAPVPVNLYIADLRYTDGNILLGRPRKLTGDRGVSSQPSFTPDGKAVIFVSRRDTVTDQSDIYRIDLASGVETRITATPEMENSPTITSDGRLMVIRWTPATLFKEWGPWKYDLSGRPLAGVLPGPDTVGYYVQLDPDTYAMVRPKTRTSVALFDARTKEMTDIDWPVANMPPQIIRGTKYISYTRTDSMGRNVIRRMKPSTRDTTTLFPALIGRVAHAWASNGFVLMGRGNAIFARRVSDSKWKQVATFSASDLQGVTAYGVSPNGSKLILYSPVKRSLATVLRDSIQSGAELINVVASFDIVSAPAMQSRFDISEGALLGIASEQTARGKTADAVALLSFAGRIYPKSYDVPFVMGETLRRAGQETGAVQAFKRSLELNPQKTDEEKRDAERAKGAIAGKPVK